METSHLPQSQLQSTIVLLPKARDDDALQHLSSWRPISLLNVDYKIFAKVLATRLRSKLDTVVRNMQKCALPGRQITDLTTFYSLLSERACWSGSPLAILQLDQKAAFDRVNQEYLFTVLQVAGVHGEFLCALRVCYENSTARVVVNNHLTREFSVQRGVRQGCPLSMLLYVLQLEPVLQWILREPHIRGVDVEGTHVKYGAYADDVTLLLADRASVVRVLRIFRHFEEVSGSSVNLAKSVGVWIGPWDRTPPLLHGISWQTDGLKVLGVWVGTAAVRSRNWENIESAVTRQLQQWRGRKLSIYGRKVAWNTYVISRYHYRAYACPLPPPP